MAAQHAAAEDACLDTLWGRLHPSCFGDRFRADPDVPRRHAERSRRVAPRETTHGASSVDDAMEPTAPDDSAVSGVHVEFQESDEDDDEIDLDHGQDDVTHDSNPKLTVNVQDIDAFWTVRKVSQAYEQIKPKEHIYKLAEEVLKVIADGDGRDVENRLVALFDFDKFDLIKLLLRNRLKILWCTRLARAESHQQRSKIEEDMRSNPSLAPILEQLLGTRASARRAAAGQGRININSARSPRRK
ncbi:hypothetical protein ACP70R_020206 [Stipagrostis hirtigluma subsp. patula]